ncbi:MAG: hypothetical protein V3S98_06215 [Dehalococcoidia bacterium]
MDWLVSHEGFADGLLHTAAGYPALPCYRGDVDSHCRRVALEILDQGKVSHLAVILRDPVDIIMSALGRNNPEAFARITRSMDGALAYLDRVASDPRVHVIKFREMVGVGDKFQEMAEFLGISDLPRCLDKSPANGPTRVFLPESQQERFRHKFKWFTEKWQL